MFEDMGPREFVGFLSALWDSRGWETGIRERDEGVFMVAGDRPDGRRGLMLVVPDPDATISGQLLQKVVRLMDEKEVDVRVAATRGTFSDDARRIGEANGVHLLDPDELEQTVAAEEAYDLVAEFSGGTAGDSLVPSVGYSLPSISRPGGRVRLVALLGVLLLIALVAVQVTGIGGTVLAGLPVPALPVPDLGPGLGGPGAGEMTVTAVSLSGGNGSVITVAWDARRQSALIAPNGKRFDAPDGQTFLVVQLNVTNPSSQPMIFRAQYLALATNNTRYGYRPLQGASGQLPVQVEPQTTRRAYVVFTVPADTREGTLLALPGPDVPPIRFEHDRDLAFQASRP